VNTGLLALGALLANLIGTTGASMLLIRPYLRINKYADRAIHVVLFIFIVSIPAERCADWGSAIVPGLPEGVPFFGCSPNPRGVGWLLTVGVLLAIFFVRTP